MTVDNELSVEGVKRPLILIMDPGAKAVSAESLEMGHSQEEYRLFNLLKGHQARVTTSSHTTFEGILSSESTLELISLHKGLRVSRENFSGRRVERHTGPTEDLNLGVADFSWIECEIDLGELEALKHHEKDGHKPVEFYKDSEHDLPSGKGGGHRTLEKRTWGEGNLGGLEDDDWKAPNAGDDQFERNKQFGYGGSSYRDEIYTTKLDTTKVSADVRAKAE